MTMVLVIEDEQAILENIMETLELAGYETDGAENGAIGVEKASEIIPDLIICDVMMPELDGWHVYQALHANPATASIPFIFLTAHADRDSVQKGYDMGAKFYVTKPFTGTQLLECVSNCLD